MHPHTIFRTHRRFLVENLPAEEGWRDRFVTALQENAFTPSPVVSKGRRAGWCIYGRPLSTDFTVQDCIFNQYALFSLRIEQRKVPARMLRVHVEAAVAAWCREHEKERAPAGVREEIRDNIELVMLKQTLPTLTTIDVMWSIQDGYLVVAAGAEAALDLVRKTFKKTFGLTTVPDSFEDPEHPVKGVLCFSDPASDFLLWLMWRGDGDAVDLDGEPVNFRVDDAVKLKGLRATGVTPSVLIALAQDKVPEALTLHVERGDRSYVVRLQGMTPTGVKLPVAVKTGDVADQLYDAAFCYEEVQAMLVGLFKLYGEERARATPQERAAIDRWMGAGMEPVAAFLARLRGEP